MSVELDIKKEDGFIRVTYRGREDLEGELGIESALLAAVDRYDCNRILHDCRAVVGPRLGTMDSFTAAASYDRRFLPVRSALLDHPRHHDENHFWETAVLNQGFTARVFDDEPEAIAWLLDDGCR